MTRIDFGFGIELDQHSVPIGFQRAEGALAAIRDRALSLFGACTLYRTEGDWRDPDSGRTFSERGCTLMVVAPEHPSLETNIRAVAEFIKEALNQRAVFVVRYPVQSELY